MGFTSHAEGNGTIASGAEAHSEGNSTAAEADASHAEGSGGVASGNASHAEGGGTAAEGTAAHAEGNGTIARGERAHAEGNESEANANDSTRKGRLVVLAMKRKLSRSHQVALRSPSQATSHHSREWGHRSCGADSSRRSQSGDAHGATVRRSRRQHYVQSLVGESDATTTD